MNPQDKFTELKTSNEGALIAYICAGDPTPERSNQYTLLRMKKA
jgi:tryptophan synthase alpha subunit